MTSFATSSLQKYINVVSKNQLTWYMEQNSTSKEEKEYYASEDYKVHLNYLIETWVSNVKDELGYNDEILDDPNLDPTFNMSLVTLFDKEWLVDLFERDVLASVCLK